MADELTVEVDETQGFRKVSIRFTPVEETVVVEESDRGVY